MYTYILASIDLITVNKFSSQRRPDNEWKIELIYFVCAIEPCGGEGTMNKTTTPLYGRG